MAVDNEVPGPAASAPSSTGKLLEIQIFRFYPRSTESELLGMGPRSLCFHKYFRWLGDLKFVALPILGPLPGLETFLLVATRKGLLLEFSGWRLEMLLTTYNTQESPTTDNCPDQSVIDIEKPALEKLVRTSNAKTLFYLGRPKQVSHLFHTFL